MSRIAVLIVATVVLVDSPATDFVLAGTASCARFLEVCKTRPEMTPEICQMYYDAAVKEGGVWASAGAREAVRRKTGNKAIMRNDSACLP